MSGHIASVDDYDGMENYLRDMIQPPKGFKRFQGLKLDEWRTLRHQLLEAEMATINDRQGGTGGGDCDIRISSFVAPATRRVTEAGQRSSRWRRPTMTPVDADTHSTSGSDRSKGHNPGVEGQTKHDDYVVPEPLRFVDAEECATKDQLWYDPTKHLHVFLPG